MTIALDSAVSSLMTNRRRVGALKSLGVVTVGDALTYYPFRVTDPVPVTTIRQVRIGNKAAFAATVRQLRVVPMNARRGFRVEALVDDAAETDYPATAHLVFFSHNKGYADWMGSRLRGGSTVVVAGDPSEFNGQLQFTHPDIVVVADPEGRSAEVDSLEAALAKVSRPQPVYHASSRISSDHIHESILGFLRLLAENGQASPDQDEKDGSDSHPESQQAVASVQASLQIQGAESIAPTAEQLSRVIPDVLPESVRQHERLLYRAQAFLAIHNPDSVQQFHEGIRTLRFEEAFISQTALLRARQQTAHIEAFPCPNGESNALKCRFIESLPFQLTQGQRSVIDDIAADMAKKSPMQRLLQGEVGSGKTVVAVAAMLQAVDAGYQAVLVAPTQVLAEQHHASITRMLGGLGDASDSDSSDVSNASDADSSAATPVPVLLLTGGMKLARRRRVLATVASGEPCIVVATHAAFSKTFQAPRLALAVIDEQHRFGVEQRETLRHRFGQAPHLLVMTATPIPRTAAMTWFGDLDVSWLTELPGGRKPIRTVVIPEADAATMARMFVHIRRRIDAGERAYIVCPRIEETSEDDASAESDSSGNGSGKRGGRRKSAARNDEEYATELLDPFLGDDSEEAESRPPMHAVEEIAKRLASLPQFHGITLATLTGRDDDETKAQVMNDFASGRTPVLVATTVIEVGVDVPQASCIVIFDADRFGLSQLHQLRGRVGRGGTDSWAFLISRVESDSIAAQRMEVIRTSTDGAQIAQADLELRGAGDVLGDAQAGSRSSLKLLRVVKDADMIATARTLAQQVLGNDPTLAGEPQLAGAVLDFTRGNERFITST